MSINNAINRPIRRLINIDSTTNLDSSAIGNTINCTGATDYTVGLPSAPLYPGQSVYFVINTTSNALVTINGLEFGNSESLTIISNGTSWNLLNYSLVNTYFTASLSSAQVIPDGVDTQLVLTGTTSLGVDYASNVFTILYPGLYDFGISLGYQADALDFDWYGTIRRSGLGKWSLHGLNMASFPGSGTSILSSFFCNAGDQFDFSSLQSSGDSQTLEPDITLTGFWGKRTGILV